MNPMSGEYHHHAAVRFAAIYENFSSKEPSHSNYASLKDFYNVLKDEVLSEKVNYFLNNAGLTPEERTAIEIRDGLKVGDGNWEKGNRDLEARLKKELPRVANQSKNLLVAREKLDAHAMSLRISRIRKRTG